MEGKKCKCSTPLIKGKFDSEIQTLLKCDSCNIQYGGIPKDGDDPLIDVDDKDISKCSRFYNIFISLTIEPVIFSFMFGYVMIMSVMSNMMMEKGCKYHFNYSVEVCSNLSGHKAEKDSVERLSADYSLYSNLLSFIAAFLMVFIAPWSDKYGRKIPLIFAVIGTLLTNIGYIFCTIYFDSPLVYLVISKIPSEVSGGFICLLTIMFSLASEQSSTENRTLKYTTVEVALGLGLTFGGLVGGQLYRYGYMYVYITAAVLHVLEFLWVLFIVEETKGLDKDMKWHEKARDFFVCESFKDNIGVTCKPRPGNTKLILLSLLASMSIIVLNYESFGTISFLYVHHVFNWDPSIYSIMTTISQLLSFVLTLSFVPIFIRVFKVNDFVLGIIGSASMIGKNLLIAFTGHKEYIYYIGLCVGIFTSLSTLSIRTGISKLVDKEEVGRIFAFLSTLEALVPMVGTLAITKLFEATMDTYPNTTYTVTAVLLLIPLVTFIWAYLSTKKANSTLSISANDHVREKN